MLCMHARLRLQRSLCLYYGPPRVSARRVPCAYSAPTCINPYADTCLNTMVHLSTERGSHRPSCLAVQRSVTPAAASAATVAGEGNNKERGPRHACMHAFRHVITLCTFLYCHILKLALFRPSVHRIWQPEYQQCKRRTEKFTVSGEVRTCIARLTLPVHGHRRCPRAAW